MKYFESFNIVNINDTKIRDLFYKVFITELDENHLVSYQLSDYETIKDVSYKFYSSTDLWWVIAFINDIYDLNYDWVLTNEEIEAISIELSTHSGVLNTDEYLEYYDRFATENDAKRNIKLIKNENIKEFVDKFVEINNNSLEPTINQADVITDENETEITTGIQDINYKDIKGTLFDVSLPFCNSPDLYVYNVNVNVILSSISISWDLPPNNNDYQAIWIVDNEESITFLEPHVRSYVIQDADLGEHEIHIILVQRKYGESINASVFVALPTISTDVQPEYYENISMVLTATGVSSYGSLTWDMIGNINDLTFNDTLANLSGILYEKSTKPVTFIATDAAGRFVRHRVDINVNRFPELSYNVESGYNQFDNILLEPILTYGYGVRTYSIDTLPAGLTMNASGVISGQVLDYGTFNATVYMVDGKNRATSYSFTLEIAEVPPAIISLTMSTDYTRTKAISIVPTVTY